jgi:hypothetical protein
LRSYAAAPNSQFEEHTRFDRGKKLLMDSLCRTLLTEVCQALGRPELEKHACFAGPPRTLPSKLATTEIGVAAVAAAGVAASDLARERDLVDHLPRVNVDSRAVATAFTSERHLRVDGKYRPIRDPLSTFVRCGDDRWVRLHANYPHHRQRLFDVLGLDQHTQDINAVRTAASKWTAEGLEDCAFRNGALAVAVREIDEWRSLDQSRAVRKHPLIELTCHQMPARPMQRHARRGRQNRLLPAADLRVLDLTRVLAGPVASRTLALFGADVLRVDHPRMAEHPTTHLDTNFGKRSTLLDFDHPTDRRKLAELLETADIVVCGYRSGALHRFGLAPSELVAQYPGIIVVSLNAWGADGPWAERRGFDSLVQAATGISMIEADGHSHPGALPVQAIDHATAYLSAAAALRCAALRVESGDSYHAQLSLARTAEWLLDAHDPTDLKDESDPGSASPWLRKRTTEFGEIAYAGPALTIDGGPVDWSTPPPVWGASQPEWLPR